MGVLDDKLNEEPGYSKYNYHNKEINNSHNNHSRKTMHTNYSNIEMAMPIYINSEYKSQLIKKYQNTITQDIKEKIFSMYSKSMTTSNIKFRMQALYDIEISGNTL